MDIKSLLANSDILGVSVLIIKIENDKISLTNVNDTAKKIEKINELINQDIGVLLNFLSIKTSFLKNKTNKDWKINIDEKEYKTSLKNIEDNISLVKLECISDFSEQRNKPSELSLFKTLLDYSPDLIYFKDKEAKFIRNSKSHCDIVGVTQDELIGKSDLDVFKDGQTKYQDDLNVINTGIPIINKEEPDVTHKGDTKWVSSSKLPIMDKNNNIIGLFGISRDITERRNAELKIKGLNDNFQVLITTSLGFQQTAKIDNLFRITGNLVHEKFDDIQLVFLYKNKYNENFDVFCYPNINTGGSSPYRNIIEYVLSNSLFDNQFFESSRITINMDELFQQHVIKGEETPDYKYAYIYQLKEKNELFGYSVIFRNTDFEDHDELFLKVLINQLTLTIARINLIEELKSSMLQAQESDRLKTAFLNNISHEIRTPLNSVIGYSQLLIGKVGDKDPQLKTFAGNVVTNAKILLELFEDIIEISKIESGKISIIKHETNINELIDSLHSYLKEQLKRYNKLHLKIECKKPEPPINEIFHIDSIRIFQLLKSFISNAVKFTENGFIRIGYNADSSKEIQFFVEDSGIGIPNEVSDIIFNLFRQGDESATRKYGGIGVGLSIANALAERLGGKISFKTEFGKGSKFYFSLPI